MNKFTVAAACHLVACIVHNPNVTSLTLDHGPSACVGHAAWQGEGLPLPPSDAVAKKGWTAVLEFLRVRGVCARSGNVPRARDACCATEPRCSFPHDLRRRTAPCSARACRVR